MTESDLELDRYRDGYTERLTQLIQDRLAMPDSLSLVATPTATLSTGDEESDLVSALMASLAITVAGDHHVDSLGGKVRTSDLTSGNSCDVTRKLG